MTIRQLTSDDGKKTSITIKGRFDFSLHKDFRNTYMQMLTKGTTFNLNLSKTTYMDSSALGMILLLKDHADNIKGEVMISSPSESVNKILEIAQFHRLFKVER